MRDGPAPITLTAAEVSSVVSGAVERGAPTRVLERYSIDSRTLARGDCFIAIKGERFDGHDFAGAAAARGAAALVVRTGAVVDVSPDVVVIRVTDTLRALQTLARHIRRLSQARVVAITGSAGKTTTKEITADLLATRFRTYRSRGNLNNQIGLPLSLLELRTRPEVAVLELGMNHAGEIRELVHIAEPDIRVWTNVGEAHLGYFASIEALADAKAEVLEGADAASTLVANADDPRVMRRTAAFAGSVVTFGLSESADVSAAEVEDLGVDGTRAAVSTPTGEARLHVPLIGRGHLANVLAAVAVALVCGVPLTDVVPRIAALTAAPHRGEVFHLPNGAVIVDDSYNSNPTALEQMAEAVGHARGFRRRIGVIGEMLELGSASIELHARSGRMLARAGFDRLIAVGGPAAAALAEAALGSGMAADAATIVGDAADASRLALPLVRSGDVVLVKGSRGIGLDRVVESLRQGNA